jgi:hypothetical protein
VVAAQTSTLVIAAGADKGCVHRTFTGTVERGENNLSVQNMAKATTLGATLLTLCKGA